MYKVLIIITFCSLLVLMVVLAPSVKAPSHVPADNSPSASAARDNSKDSLVKQCLADYPQSDFSDCIPGQVQDGWTQKALYPNSLDTTGLDQQADMFIPKQVLDGSAAIYNNSASTCQTSWMIRENGQLREVSKEEFCDFVVDYNEKCNNCLLVWQGGCC